MAEVSAPRRTRRRPSLHILVLAACAYVPALLTAPGQLAADTKAYLFLAPGRLLERAAWMWDPNVAMGTVTHQNIGYMFPLGPYFWLIEQLPVPMWVGQRIWIATTLFAAGSGVIWLGRRLGIRGAPLLAAALVYQLSPYTLAYLGRTTVILFPFAALPWLIGLARRSLLEGGWRAPAWFALVVTLVGSTNASSLVFIGLAPVFWFPFAVWVLRESDVRSALAAMGRIGGLLVLTQAWWIAGLSLQAGYGLPILDLTETVKTVADTSTAAEIARHLGYWYFYGRDGLESWTESAAYYTQTPGLILVSFALPGLCLLGAAMVRWRHRAYAIGLVLVGLVIGIGTHPYDDPQPVAGAIKAATDVSTAGMALRNSPRAVPLLVLGMALLVGAGLTALGPAVQRWRGGRFRFVPPVATGLVIALAVVNMAPLWTGGLVQSNLEFPEELPEYWQEATEALDERDDGTRVLEIPGMDFGTYRWGNTQDVVTPGLVDRPWVGRQLIPFGSPAGADLIRAFDRRFQEGWLEPGTIAPYARLVGAGDVLLRSDTQYERYRSPRPRWLWSSVIDGIPGLGAPTAFGNPFRNRAAPAQPMEDETELTVDPDLPDPPPVLIYPVEDARGELRSATRPEVLLAGDGDGVVDLMAADLLHDETFVYAATFAEEPDRLASMAADGARLVLTDTNRRRAQRWGTLRENSGYTEQAGETALVEDPSDERLEVFPDAGDESYTVTELRGVAAVRASTYGNPVSYTPEDRPANAVDGSLETAWSVGAFSDIAGERLMIELEQPVVTDHIDVVQLPAGNRTITELELRLDGSTVGTYEIHPESRDIAGQRLEFPEQEIRSAEIVLTGSNVGSRADYVDFSPVGFTEVRIPGIELDQLIVLPRDLLDAVGPAAATAPLDVVLTRLRANRYEPFRSDPEPGLTRVVELPAERSFSLDGVARLPPAADDHLIDRVLGVPDALDGRLAVRTSDFISGAVHMRGRAALDGDPTTMWSPGFTDQVGRWIEVESEEPITIDHLDLQIVADGRHSLPTRLEVRVDDEVVEVDLPSVPEGTAENHVEEVTVPVPPMTGNLVRLTVTGVAETHTVDYYSTSPLTMPVAFAELGIEGVRAEPPPERLPDVCRDDLVTVDGSPLPVRVTGTTDDAVAGRALGVETCGQNDLLLGPGEVEIRSAPGNITAIDIDRLVLSSEATRPAPEPSEPPEVAVVDSSRLGRDVHVTGIDGPFWLVFGQNESDGWSATTDSLGDLGDPTLVDGYANGWYVDPPAGVTEMSVAIEWAPQERVWLGIAASVAGIFGCLAILVFARRRAPFGAGVLDAPALADPTRSGGSRPRPLLAFVAAAGCGVVTALLAGPPIGAVVAAASAIALTWDRGRVLLSVPPWAVFGPVGVYVAGRQWGYEYRTGIEWPTAFDPAKWFVLGALLLLGADVVVQRIRAVAARRARSAEGAGALVDVDESRHEPPGDPA